MHTHTHIQTNIMKPFKRISYLNNTKMIDQVIHDKVSLTACLYSQALSHYYYHPEIFQEGLKRYPEFRRVKSLFYIGICCIAVSHLEMD